MIPKLKPRVLLLAVAVVAVFGIGYLLGGTGGSPADAGTAAHTVRAASPTTWTCSMHPRIKLPASGQCPLCFMDLIPLETNLDDDPGPTTLVMSERAAALAEIRTVPVERRPVKADVRLVGVVNYDETRYRTITAWVPGRIDELFVDFTGRTVEVGERLVSLYSPTLFAAQTELLHAIAADRDVARSASPLVRETSTATIESARRRLGLWGLDDRQIRAIEDRGRPDHHMDIPSPLAGVVVGKNAVAGMYVETGTELYTVADLSRVWVDLEAYESDLALLGLDQEITFTVAALPGETLHGSVIFIDPVLDTRKRTVKIRLAADNRDGRLKPGMLVDAVVGGAPGGTGDPLVIPASAPLITGKRAVVYVQVPDREQPTFEGRVVELGPRAGDSYVVASGLTEGDVVVVKGNFKIDSALQIQAKPSMMNPHGDHAAPEEPFAAPETFRGQLDAVLAAYLDAQEALAVDDDGTATAAAARLSAALDVVDMTLLEGDAHMAWIGDLKPLREAAGAFNAAGDIASRRGSLQGLSNSLWRALDRFGVSRGETVRLFHCPMADGNKGADWLQLATETANPYFGASMLRCGSQTDTLSTYAAGER